MVATTEDILRQINYDDDLEAYVGNMTNEDFIQADKLGFYLANLHESILMASRMQVASGDINMRTFYFVKIP